jgi:hypothetical protein
MFNVGLHACASALVVVLCRQIGADAAPALLAGCWCGSRPCLPSTPPPCAVPLRCALGSPPKLLLLLLLLLRACVRACVHGRVRLLCRGLGEGKRRTSSDMRPGAGLPRIPCT